MTHLRKGQAFGNRAKQFVSALAFGKEVKVEVKDHDRYGRTVADVILPDGRNLNHEIVKAGFAWWYRKYAPKDTELEALESEARAAKRGLWADPRPVPPWEWRKRVHATPNRFESDPLGFRTFLSPIDSSKTLCELFKRGWSRISSTPFF